MILRCGPYASSVSVSLATCYKRRFSSPIQDLLNQKLEARVQHSVSRKSSRWFWYVLTFEDHALLHKSDHNISPVKNILAAQPCRYSRVLTHDLKVPRDLIPLLMQSHTHTHIHPHPLHILSYRTLLSSFLDYHLVNFCSSVTSSVLPSWSPVTQGRGSVSHGVLDIVFVCLSNHQCTCTAPSPEPEIWTPQGRDLLSLILVSLVHDKRYVLGWICSVFTFYYEISSIPKGREHSDEHPLIHQNLPT